MLKLPSVPRNSVKRIFPINTDRNHFQLRKISGLKNREDRGTLKAIHSSSLSTHLNLCRSQDAVLEGPLKLPLLIRAWHDRSNAAQRNQVCPPEKSCNMNKNKCHLTSGMCELPERRLLPTEFCVKS